MPTDLQRLKDKIDYCLNEYLSHMHANFDDSICGFNEAWDLVREILQEEIEKSSPTLIDYQ